MKAVESLVFVPRGNEREFECRRIEYQLQLGFSAFKTQLKLVLCTPLCIHSSSTEDLSTPSKRAASFVECVATALRSPTSRRSNSSFEKTWSPGTMPAPGGTRPPRRARLMAPTIAINNSTDVISNGRR